jgi:hypothetical protein
MTLILSGTSGLSDIDGSAATPAIRGTDANTGIFFGADIIGFAKGGAEVARFNADAQFVAAAGTASLPVITTTGDVNTGIFFPAADTIAFSEGGVEAMRLDSSANLQFNSGYGSVATAYGCRAWVNFNGGANTNLSGTYARTSPSTTLTVTATAHGLIVGNSVNLDFTTGTGLDGVYTVVTVVDADTFTVTTVASTTTSGNVTLLRNTIRASGNVSSITDNGTGDYTVNFTTAMPDANYAVSYTRSFSSPAPTGTRAHFTIAGSQTTTTVRIAANANNNNTTAEDVTDASVAIFR